MDLNLIDALTPDIIEFDGPATRCIGEKPYVTLTQFGVKGEGESAYPDDKTRHWVEAEAIWHFKRMLSRLLSEGGAQQLAWRQRPEVTQGPDGDYLVRCRLALLANAPAIAREVA